MLSKNTPSSIKILFYTLLALYILDVPTAKTIDKVAILVYNSPIFFTV
jgi:hypothetical protein